MTRLLPIPHCLYALLLLFVAPRVFADPATLDFNDCFSGNASQKLSVSSVYGQVVNHELHLVVLGQTPLEIDGFTNFSKSLATLFTTTSVLTLSAWSNSSYLCTALRPPSPLPALNNSNSAEAFCPIPPGPFGFSSVIPWGNNRALTTLDTHLRAVDPFSNELVCIDVYTTPMDPTSDSPYGRANIILWATVSLAVAYWVVVGIARIVSALGRGITRHDRGIWSRAQSAGFILASAISGERLSTSPALLRFCTPSLRDVIFHTQWCAVLAMVAVDWPEFAYPLLTQTAWSTLSYNITLVQSSAHFHWDPLSTLPYSPPSNFADQLADSSSPLYLNPLVPNTIFTLPENARNGISSFAYTLGVRPQDLFPICLILFLGIIAAAIFLSALVWFIDHMVCSVGSALSGSGNAGPNSVPRLTGTRSPGFSATKELDTNAAVPDENKSLNGNSILSPSIVRTSSRFGLPLSAASDRGISSHRPWWKLRSDIGAFHGSILHGNLVRILVLFHLPVTIFSCYQMTLPRSQASLSSIVLAGFSFAFFSILIPAHLVLRVTFTPTNKLYDETKTLLCLGPLYNHYRHGSQMFASMLFATNIVFGITIGVGQKSGMTQAIIILVVEVISALVTSIWLPWGSGASMGLISFLFCVARIVIAVLLVILTPTISIGAGPGGWVAYGILIILALVYAALLLILIVKIMEAVVRIAGLIGFDKSKHVVDSGLLGACGLLGCFGPRNKRRRNEQRARARTRNHPYKPSELQSHNEHRDSGSSYVPPALLNQGSVGDSVTPPRFQGSDSRKGSTNSGAPPSVLKPEHAMRPYREDSEDEGFIMGAWQPSRKAGYAPVMDAPLSTTPTSTIQKASQSTTNVTQSGFSRVGGGRAHIDTPYAITTGSTHTFPSIGQNSNPGFSAAALFDDDNSPPPSLSSVGVGRQAPDMGALPPGAMQPSHIRTKSQTAIIEDASKLASSSSGPQHQFPVQPRRQYASSGGLLRSPVVIMGDNDEDDGSEDAHPKKKPWYHLRRSKVNSEGSPVSPASMPIDAELGGLSSDSTSQPGRSFVVVRKPKLSTGRLGQPNSKRLAHDTT
ncbi:hypothetical protein L208DRAFT_1399050 [Tricholoma matsutake]|nr:hypothetical protein L208DRAFT_1399050 [Tricholoma matsutake 945]